MDTDMESYIAVYENGDHQVCLKNAVVKSDNACYAYLKLQPFVRKNNYSKYYMENTNEIR